MERANPIAERRRQRKLENQRLEEEARRKHEEVLQQKGRERQRIEDERRAEEQRVLLEREERFQIAKAEASRVAAIERQERQKILDIEKKLKLVGAFCTESANLPACSSEAYPTCMAVMPRNVAEAVVGATVDSDIVFVADSTATVHVFARKAAAFVVYASLQAFVACAGSSPVSMVRLRCCCCPKIPILTKHWSVALNRISRCPQSQTATRSGLLLICIQNRIGFLVIQIRELLQTYQPVAPSLDLIPKPRRVDVSPLWIPLAAPGISMHGMAFDDTSDDLFLCEQAKHQVVAFNLAGVAELTVDAGSEGSRIAAWPDRSVCIDRTFGRRGRGKGEVKRPLGLDISHYHVVVCDSGNSRIVMFTKRGGFVQAIGCRGRGPCEFMDIRDIVVANVRKRALSRGLVADDKSVSNEQFDIIVADLGNFRVQILDENGNFTRQLSLLAGVDQVAFQQDQLGILHAALLKEYASLRIEAPALMGDDMQPLYGLARLLHPTDPAYERVSEAFHQWRSRRSRYHHPFAVGFVPLDREIAVVDRDNAHLHLYNMDGSRCAWLSILPSDESAPSAMASMHSCLELELPSAVGSTLERRWFVSDPLANRVAVIDAAGLQVLSLIGESTYGDQHECSPGYLPGELNHPTYLATFRDEDEAVLIVSDSGNHSVSLFDARQGEFRGRIGNGFGHTEGYFDSPQGVAVLNNQHLYVVDQRNHRIQVFDLQGDRWRLLRMFGSFGSAPGQLNFPSGISVCAALPSAPACDFGPHRGAKIAVADTRNCRIQVLDLEGAPQILISMEQTPFDLPLMPLGVWIEQRSGYLLVTDGVNQCVAMFRNDGSFLSSVGAALERENRFVRPISVVIAKRVASKDGGEPSARVLITDGERRQVCAFKMGQLAQ